MVFFIPIRFILAAGILMITVFILTPILYDVWANSLRDLNTPENQIIGDRAFLAFQIMSFVVAGVLILWGFASAQQQRVREEEF